MVNLVLPAADKTPFIHDICSIGSLYLWNLYYISVCRLLKSIWYQYSTPTTQLLSNFFFSMGSSWLHKCIKETYSNLLNFRLPSCGSVPYYKVQTKYPFLVAGEVLNVMSNGVHCIGVTAYASLQAYKCMQMCMYMEAHMHASPHAHTQMHILVNKHIYTMNQCFQIIFLYFISKANEVILELWRKSTTLISVLKPAFHDLLIHMSERRRQWCHSNFFLFKQCVENWPK